MKRVAVYAALIVGMALSSGCVGSKPVIVEIRPALAFRYDLVTQSSFESLSIYVLVSDDDGINDIDELYVLHDDQSLFWKLTSETWDSSQNRDEVWIGSQALRLPQSRFIPRGEYRIQLYDRAGELATRKFTLFENKDVDDFRSPLPELAYLNGALNLSSVYDDNVVRWYHGETSQVYDYVGGDGEINTQEIIPVLHDLLSSRNGVLPSSSPFYIYSYPDGRNSAYYMLVGPIML